MRFPWQPSSTSTEAHSPLHRPEDASQNSHHNPADATDAAAAADLPADDPNPLEEHSPEGVTDDDAGKSIRPWSLWGVLGAAAVLVALSLGLGIGLGIGLKASDDSGPIIDLGYAKYRGSYLQNDISEFLGMRFARPPTGELRWRAPVPPDKEDSIQRAKNFKPICYGMSTPRLILHKEDEDCLYVNIWGPTNATADMKLPVLVFIQGGGYTSNANPNWNGSRLVQVSDNNLIYVNFNYRVGLWGFLAGEDVRRDGDLNAGLLDQRYLLKWVQTHISSFGGDPGHVVIQGVSAGAGSTALHLTAYGGRNDGLFIGAISESTFVPAHPPVSEVEYQLDYIMQAAGCGEEETRMSCLREKSKSTLQALNVPSPFPGRTNWPVFYFTPCIDGELLQDTPSSMYEAGKFIDVPMVSGTCTNEGTVFTPNVSSPSQLTSFLLDNYPTLSPSDLSQILDLYPLEDPLPFHNAYFPSASRAYGDVTFICPTNNILEYFNSSNSWSYRYNVQELDTVQLGFGVPHVAEVPAVIGPDMLSYPANPSYYTYNAPVVSLVMKYWLSFARSLDPNTYRLNGAPVWGAWGTNQSRIVLQVHDTAMEAVGHYERERCNFWKDISPRINQR